MKKAILFLAVSLFAFGTYSQNDGQNEYEEWKSSQDEYTDFDIGKYFTPNIVRNQLEINLDLYSDYSRNDYSYSDSDDRLDKNSIFSGNISSSFSHYLNTRKRISSLVVELSFKEDYSSLKNKKTFVSDNSTIEDKYVGINSVNSLFLNWSNKWYFSKLIYMDYGIYSRFSYNFKQGKIIEQERDSIKKQKGFASNISPRLGIGYGRIENVQDARQAVYIVNALSKKKVLTRNLTNDELFELSQKISTVKNKRFLDSRLHLIDEVTSVDSFFVSNNLLADNGAAYFTTLYDMWQYGDLFARKSGYEISLVACPHFYNINVEYNPEERKIFNMSWLWVSVMKNRLS